jgi:hypothetical protein
MLGHMERISKPIDTKYSGASLSKPSFRFRRSQRLGLHNEDRTPTKIRATHGYFRIRISRTWRTMSGHGQPIVNTPTLWWGGDEHPCWRKHWCGAKSELAKRATPDPRLRGLG